MLLSKEERKIVAQAMSMLHLTTDSEKELFKRVNSKTLLEKITSLFKK